MLSDQKEKGSVFFLFLNWFFLFFILSRDFDFPSSLVVYFFFIIFLFWLFAFSPLALLCSCFCWTVSVSVLCVHAQLLSVDADRSTKRDFGLVSRFHVASGGVGQSGGVSNGPQPNGGPTGWHGQLQELNQTVLHTHSLNTLQKKRIRTFSTTRKRKKQKNRKQSRLPHYSSKKKRQFSRNYRVCWGRKRARHLFFSFLFHKDISKCWFLLRTEVLFDSRHQVVSITLIF